MKEHKTTFTCDNCQKQITINKDAGFPYQEKWCYIFNFEAKTLRLYTPAIDIDVAEVKMKDKHFCCEKCLFEYVKTAFIVEKDIKPENIGSLLNLPCQCHVKKKVSK